MLVAHVYVHAQDYHLGNDVIIFALHLFVTFGHQDYFHVKWDTKGQLPQLINSFVLC